MRTDSVLLHIELLRILVVVILDNLCEREEKSGNHRAENGTKKTHHRAQGVVWGLERSWMWS